MFDPPEGYVSVREAARRLKCEPSTIRKRVRSGELDALCVPTAPRGKCSHLYLIDERSIESFTPVKPSRTNRRYQPSLSRPDEKEILTEMLALFHCMQRLNPADVAAQIRSKKGAQHIHRDFWPVLAWLSFFFEELNNRKKDEQLTLDEGREA